MSDCTPFSISFERGNQLSGEHLNKVLSVVSIQVMCGNTFFKNKFNLIQ